MPYNAIVSDWNGSLFEYATDEIMNRKIAYAVLGDAKAGLTGGNLLRRGDVAGLLRAIRQLERMLLEYKSGERNVVEVYEPFNERIVKGVDAAFIEGIADDYARESSSKVDRRMLRPLRAARTRGTATGILSASFTYAIQRILQEAGFDDVFDDIVANTLQTENSRAAGFTMNIHGERADALMEEFYRKRGFSEAGTLYIGDTEDDEPVADCVARGHYIVPLLASDAFKQHMASRYGAFVPESEDDLACFLEKT